MEIGVRYLPCIVVFLFLLTIGIKLHLALSINNNNNTEDDGGNCSTRNIATDLEKKEICFFGQVGNLLWVLGSLTIYVKYRQVKDILNRYDMNNKKTFNRLTLQVGLVGFFGVSISANFQEANSFYIYWIGVFLFFGVGSLYQCMQTTLYWSLTKIIGQGRVTPFRIILSAISMILFVVFFTSAMLKNQEEDHKCELHMVSTIFEFICATSTMVYSALFYWEFTKITLYEPDVFVIEKFTTSVTTPQTNEAFDDN